MTKPSAAKSTLRSISRDQLAAVTGGGDKKVEPIRLEPGKEPGKIDYPNV